jgi:hypothetical protein
MGGGGRVAPRSARHEPKKTGAHARPKPTSKFIIREKLLSSGILIEVI